MVLVTAIPSLNGSSTLGTEILTENGNGGMIKKTLLSHEYKTALLQLFISILNAREK